MSRAALVAAAATFLLVAATAHAPASVEKRAKIWYVVDGDTVRLSTGRYVRLVQIDSPEVDSHECYGKRSTAVLRRWLHEGSSVRLVADRRLDKVDRYGRLLRYVYRGSRNLNVALVSHGAATVWFYDGDKGRYASRLLHAGKSARRHRRGLWGACRATWNPYGPATTHFKRH